MTTLIHAALALALSLPALGADSLEKTLNVKVCEKGPIALTLAADPQSILPGDSSTLSWTAPSNATLTLDPGGPVTGNSATVSPSPVGSYTYTLSAADNCGNTGSASVTVTVRQMRVFLSGSRFYTPPSVGDYMVDYTVDPNFGYAEGASVHSFVDSNASASERAGFDEFAADMKGWPRSVEAFQTAHVPGNTYIVDEKGDVIGSLPTAGLFDNGLPGLSYLGNPWGNGDYNKVFVGDATLKFQGVDYDVCGFASVSPIILDLDGDGKPDVDRGQWLPHPRRFNRSRAVLFDISATGFPNITEWIGPHDGLLVAPLKPGETVEGGQKLFGNPIGYMDGYQKLGLLFDKNHDGVISGKELDGLMVWQDLNSNGRVDPGELKPVRAWGITSISVKDRNLRSTFVIRGKERYTWDWWPTSMLVYPRPIAQAPAQK